VEDARKGWGQVGSGKRLQLRGRACWFAKLVGRRDGSHRCEEQDPALSGESVSQRIRGLGWRTLGKGGVASGRR
jgi:hypothetical protein